MTASVLALRRRTRRLALDVRMALGIGALSVYGPILATFPLGLLLGDTLRATEPLSLRALLAHNAAGSLLLVLAGLATLGVLGPVMSAVGWSVNGYSLGVVVAERGAGELAAGMVHFAPETAGCAVLAAAGSLYGTRVALRCLDRPLGDRTTAATALGGLVAVGLGLLVVAAVIEALVLPG